jgi:hypothetical protein
MLLYLTVVAVYLLHQDFWFWREIRPLVFGFLPVGLAYHIAYMFLVAGLMGALVRWGWEDGER